MTSLHVLLPGGLRHCTGLTREHLPSGSRGAQLTRGCRACVSICGEIW